MIRAPHPGLQCPTLTMLRTTISAKHPMHQCACVACMGVQHIKAHACFHLWGRPTCSAGRGTVRPERCQTAGSSSQLALVWPCMHATSVGIIPPIRMCIKALLHQRTEGLCARAFHHLRSNFRPAAWTHAALFNHPFERHSCGLLTKQWQHPAQAIFGRERGDEALIWVCTMPG